jgi:hypothetical protein
MKSDISITKKDKLILKYLKCIIVSMLSGMEWSLAYTLKIKHPNQLEVLEEQIPASIFAITKEQQRTGTWRIRKVRKNV